MVLDGLTLKVAMEMATEIGVNGLDAEDVLQGEDDLADVVREGGKVVVDMLVIMGIRVLSKRVIADNLFTV